MPLDLEEQIFQRARKAWFTWILLLVLLGVYLLSAGPSWRRIVFGPLAESLMNFGALNAKKVDNGDWTRLFRSVFLHGDLLHLALNGFALFVLGRIGEGIYGVWRFALLIGLSGFLGSVLSWSMGATNTVGASGAIFGLLGALVVYGWKRRESLNTAFGQALRKQLAFWGIVNLAVGFAIPFVDNAAHCGGLVAGLLLGMVLGDRQ